MGMLGIDDLATVNQLTGGLVGKVDKVTGKGLSTEDFSSDEKTKLQGIQAGAQVNPDLSSYATKTAFNPGLVPLSTGVVSGGGLSINAGDSTKLDIAAGVGLVVDNSAYPPSIQVIEWTAKTAVTITNLLTAPSTDIAINSSGEVVQQATFGANELRSLIFLGGVDHDGNTQINNTFNVQVPSYGVGLSVRDLARAIGDINISGNAISANGANLKINKSAGSTFSFGRNSVTSVTDPHTITQAAQSPVTFRYVYNNASGTAVFGASVTDINTTQYDGGAGSLATAGNNKWTIQRVVMFSNTGNVFIQYGTAQYDKKSDAIAALVASHFPALSGIKTAMTIGFIVVKRGATSLANADDVEFVEASRFGGVGITGCGYAEWGGITGTITDQADLVTYVAAQIAALVDTAPATLDTLNELAAALGDDPNFATTFTNAIAGKEPIISAGATGQYWRGDKTWQTLDKSAVSLGNVDNTSDANKPVSTAQQAALDQKASLSLASFTRLQLAGKEVASYTYGSNANGRWRKWFDKDGNVVACLQYNRGLTIPGSGELAITFPTDFPDTNIHPLHPHLYSGTAFVVMSITSATAGQLSCRNHNGGGAAAAGSSVSWGGLWLKT